MSDGYDVVVIRVDHDGNEHYPLVNFGEFTMSDFISLCDSATDDEIVEIAANCMLNRIG
jgi:hypothetical protein